MARPRSSTSKLILSFPSTMPAKEVLAAVKAKGLKTTESNVYRVRRLGKKAARKATARTATAGASMSPRRRGRGRPPKTTVASSGAEDLLRAVAAEIGLARALDVLQNERAKVSRFIRG